MDPEMLSTVSRTGKTVVLMHMRGTPETMTTMTDYPDGVVETVGRELLARVEAAEAADTAVADCSRSGDWVCEDAGTNLELLEDWMS
jgi:dihydropteroate synthase